MKATKKILALVLALTMTLALGTVTAFAGDGEPAGGETPTVNVPSAADTATVTIKNVEAGATVTLYRIVEPEYTTAGLKGYKAATGVSIANVKAPTAAEVSAIAQDPTGLTTVTATLAEGATDYTATVGAGTWMVLVKGAGATVYNPMIVSVNYDEESEAVGGSVDAQTNWTLGDETAYAKSTTPTVDKKIVSTDPVETNTNCNASGNDVAIGDTVNYEIDTAIPSYSTQYTSVKFDISDTLSTGLTLNHANGEIVVTVGGTAVAASDTTYSLDATDTGFTISFANDYIMANGTKAVVVTYSAVVNENADLNFDPNTNTAKIEFSNDPTDSSKTGTDEDKTYTYTFEIDGNLNGTETGKTYRTHEVIKVFEDGSVEVVSEDTELLDEIEVTNPLAGAVFTLTNTTTNKVYTGTSDDGGYLGGFTGLDAGTYTLVETQAPEGYVVDTTVHTVVISATYNTDGTLASYTITIDGKTTSTYTATYNTEGEITEIEGTQDTLTIENTEMPNLPSTGGIGTTLFYVFGALLVIAAGVLLITRKRMRKQD